MLIHESGNLHLVNLPVPWVPSPVGISDYKTGDTFNIQLQIVCRPIVGILMFVHRTSTYRVNILSVCVSQHFVNPDFCVFCRPLCRSWSYCGIIVSRTILSGFLSWLYGPRCCWHSAKTTTKTRGNGLWKPFHATNCCCVTGELDSYSRTVGLID